MGLPNLRSSQIQLWVQRYLITFHKPSPTTEQILFLSKLRMSRYSSLLPLLVLVSVLLEKGESIRCYDCRSDELPDCGDPFISSRIPSTECDNFFTQPTFSCVKTSANAAGRYITIRGCAPFTTDSFPGALQKGLAGSYWNGYNVMSFCDFDNCNSATDLRSPATLTLLLISLMVLSR